MVMTTSSRCHLSPRHGRSPADAVGEFAAEFQAPLPDRLVGDRDAASRQHLLNHAQAQREPEIQPDRVADELGRSSDSQHKEGLGGVVIQTQIPDYPGSAKPEAAQLDGALSTTSCICCLENDNLTVPGRLVSRVRRTGSRSTRAPQAPQSSEMRGLRAATRNGR